MATPSTHLKLAQTLPPRLLRFFARFPPPPSAFTRSLAEPRESPTTGPALDTSSIDPNADSADASTVSTDRPAEYENPFRNVKHSVTGNWHDPIYSLRRQAELVKLAREHGVETLLPTSAKGIEERVQRRAEHGLRVKGTGVGQKVKGHWWERTLKGRLEKRRKAIMEMPQMIQTWKQLGHGRGWKKFPK